MSRRVLLLALLIATFLAYLPTLWYEFVSDDRFQILGNFHIQSWHYLPSYFTGHVWSHAELSFPANHYRPVFLIWLRVQYLLFGFAPWGWHLALVGLHLLVTYLVYRLARRVTNDEWSALIAALVFGLHPIHIESVAWVSGLSDPLAATFLVAGVLCYVSERDGSPWRIWRPAASWLLYVLALLSKETAAVLPLLLFAFEWTHAGPPAEDAGRKDYVKRIAASLSPTLPYWALTGAYLIARGVVLKGLAHVGAPLPLSTVLLTLPSELWFYLRHLFWPVGLNGMYGLPYVSQPDLARFFLPLLGTVGLAVTLGVAAVRSSRMAYAAAWLVLPLLPVLDPQFQPRDNFLHDRYLYIPSIGLALLAALTLRGLEKRVLASSHPRMVRLLPFVLLGGLLATGTMLQSGYWKDDIVLTTHELRDLPASLTLPAKTNLGIALAEHGRWDEASKTFQEILAQDSNFFSAYYNLGYFSYRAGRLDEAERYLLRALEIKPSDSATVLCLGLVRFKQGRLDEAEATIRQAIKMRPDAWGYHFALGFVLKTRGDLGGARREFRQELALNPTHSPAREQVRELDLVDSLRPSGAAKAP